MKIGIAQTKPVKGDIASNIRNHKKLVDLSAGAELIIFPELSITGYEPELATQLATGKDDIRFDEFQQISNNRRITIGIGAPIKVDPGIHIGMILFQPHQPRQVYCKQHLHADEFPFFVNGTGSVYLNNDTNKTALAICYELSVPEHSAAAYENNARIYIASVAKTADGVEKAAITLSEIAKKYSMTVFMSNCIGPCNNFQSAGRSSVWNDQGVLVGQLDDAHEGILVFDTDTQETTSMTM